MPLESQLRKNEKEEMIQVWIPKKRMRRPFPLVWGLMALGLFALFAIITQVQFSRIADDKIYAARVDTWRGDVRAYDTAVQSHAICVASIDIRETYVDIFEGISALFQRTADLPATLNPYSENAKLFRDQLTQDIDKLINDPVTQGLPPKKESDCPQIPEVEPVKP